MIDLGYVVPKVFVQRDPVAVSLEAFKEEDIAEYLRQRGFEVNGAFSTQLLDAARSQGVRRRRYGDDDDPDDVSGLLIEDAQLARVYTLAVCGQVDAAREFVLQIISDHIGRRL